LVGLYALIVEIVHIPIKGINNKFRSNIFFYKKSI